MKRKMQEHQLPSNKIVKNHDPESNDWICLLDLNYSSKLLSTKIADIPLKLKYETIIAPIFEYCFGTSDQDILWDHDNEISFFENHVYDSTGVYLIIDWKRDETFIYSQIFNLAASSFITLTRKLGLITNRKFFMNAIHYFSGTLWILVQLNPLFESDYEMVMEAVKEDGSNLKYASDELRKDREIVRQAVKQDGFAIYYTSESDELLDDKELVMIALESAPKTAYEYASYRLRTDRDIAFKAISHGCKIGYIDQLFYNDREFILLSSKINGKNGHETLQFACSKLREDKEIILQTIQQSPFSFCYASKELKNDREFVKEVVEKYGQCLRYAKEEFKDDLEIVELALKSSPDVFRYISSRFRTDFEFITKILGKRGFEYLPNEFSNDRDIVLESIKLNPGNLEIASMELRNDREFILQLVKNCGMVYQFINDEFKSDREIIMEAVTQNGDSLQFIPLEYYNDEEIIIKSIQTATNIHCFENLSDRLKQDREFLKKCSSAFFNSFPRKYQMDREIVMQVVKTNPDLVLQYSYPMAVSDRVLAMRIVKRNGLLLVDLPYKYRNDREIVSFAIQAFKYVSDELQKELKTCKSN